MCPLSFVSLLANRSKCLISSSLNLVLRVHPCIGVMRRRAIAFQCLEIALEACKFDASLLARSSNGGSNF